MDWVSADPEDRARRHMFDSDVIDEDGDWLVAPVGSEVPPAWVRPDPLPPAAAPSEAHISIATVDLTEEFIDLTEDLFEKETPAEARARANLVSLT